MFFCKIGWIWPIGAEKKSFREKGRRGMSPTGNNENIVTCPCADKLRSALLKTVSSGQNNAIYVAEPFDVQIKWMKKTVLNSWWQETNGFSKFINRNIASGTNHTSTMKHFDSLYDYFANIRKSLTSGSNCSTLEKTIISKYIYETSFLYPKDANGVYNLIRNYRTIFWSGVGSLKNNLLKLLGAVLSDFLAVVFIRYIEVRCFPNVLKIAKKNNSSRQVACRTPKTTIQLIVIIE